MRELWQKTLGYFGLAEEEPYEDEYDDLDDDRLYTREASTVRRITRSPDLSRAERASALRSVQAPAVRVNIVEPKGFNDAQQIADKFKAKQPVWHRAEPVCSWLRLYRPSRVHRPLKNGLFLRCLTGHGLLGLSVNRHTRFIRRKF